MVLECTTHLRSFYTHSTKLCSTSAMGFVQDAFKSSYGSEKPKFFWWYPEGTPAKERKLLTKIDFFILTYCCLGYFAKWLDRKQSPSAISMPF